MNAITKHRQTGPDGSGYYAVRVEKGQAIDMTTLKMLPTVHPVIEWHDDSGATTRAWTGQAWDAERNATRAQKAAQLAGNAKCAELRRYYALNDRRWEIVKDEERAAAKARRDEEIAAAKRLRLAGTDLLKAGKRLLEAWAAPVFDVDQPKTEERYVAAVRAMEDAADEMRAAIAKAEVAPAEPTGGAS